MSYQAQDRYDEPLFDSDEVCCEICGEACTLHGDNNYCDVCQERIDREEQEAETVRLIFQRYSELKSVRLLKQDLDRRGLVSKIRIGKDGLRMGGKGYSRGKLYKLLSNPIYIGEIRHLQTCHPGLHEAIIDRDTWKLTQQLLARHAIRGEVGSGQQTSPLAHKLIDESGQALTPTHAVKNRL